MRVAFLNENTLGHTSYLPRYIDEFLRRPELGIEPVRLDAWPLPAGWERHERGIRGLRRYGLDFLITRWRVAVSRHARQQLERLDREAPVGAVVVNTQAAGLALADWRPDCRVLVALDATVEQLARSAWFAPVPAARWFHPLTLRRLRKLERALYRRADLLLPWSLPVADSLRGEYGIPAERIRCLPPSLHAPPLARREAPRGGRARLLFIGGDLRRKGGEVLLAAWRAGLRDVADLDLVTGSPVGAEPGLRVFHGVRAGDPLWRELWSGADLFVFPSTLETFGIVLIEALAFGVPPVSTRVGAAEDILDGGRCGGFIGEATVDGIVAAVRDALSDPARWERWRDGGRRRFEERYALDGNARMLAAAVRG